MKINNNLKKIRKEHNLTAQELAETIGVSRQFLSTMENGYRPIPKAVAKKLASYFNVSVDALYGLDSIKIATDITVAFKNLIDHFRQNTELVEKEKQLLKVIEHLIEHFETNDISLKTSNSETETILKLKGKKSNGRQGL